VVVFVHELGHFIAARSVGIDVEAFSIGWGRPLYKRTMGGVEYRIAFYPWGVTAECGGRRSSGRL